jgi:purine-binding chemotaxis protein CheW
VDKSEEAGPQRGTSVSRQVLTFRLGEEIYGINLTQVKEIRVWTPVTRVPQSPSQVLGVLNMRGAIVPIIDLRLRFDLPSVVFTSATVIIVISLNSGEGSKECGLVVDAVSDVVDLDAGMLRQAPQFLASPNAAYIDGLAAMGEQLLILLKADDLVRLDVEVPAGSQEKAA